MHDSIAPIFIALSAMGTFIGFFHYQSSSKKSLHSAVEKALEKGEKLTPELLQTLQTPNRGKFGDLRKGVLWLAVGLAMVAVGLVGPKEHDALYFSLFPILIGLGYVVIWKLNPENDTGK